MAVFTRKSRTEGVSAPALLLINDHQKVERIFEEIKQADSPIRREGLMIQLEGELTRHTTIEEVVLYPFIEDNVPGGEGLISEAEGEHQQATKLLERVVNLDPSSPDFLPALDELEKAVSHHVKEEEHELFPKMEDATDGPTLARLRLELEQEKLGLSPQPKLPAEVTGGRAVSSTTPAKSTASSGKRNVWVQPHPKDDRWQVKRDGATRASRLFDSQAEAETYGRKLAKDDKVELIIAGRDGAIRDKASYGNDPSNVPG
jgi:iron-sulfur cluster repair protein YtfE (RIC family)